MAIPSQKERSIVVSGNGERGVKPAILKISLRKLHRGSGSASRHGFRRDRSARVLTVHVGGLQLSGSRFARGHCDAPVGSIFAIRMWGPRGHK